MTTCIARKSCYAELYQNELNRGCDPTPLACENRRPSGLQQLEWPALYCCRHKNLCNKHAIPSISSSGENMFYRLEMTGGQNCETNRLCQNFYQLTVSLIYAQIRYFFSFSKMVIIHRGHLLSCFAAILCDMIKLSFH